jgi:hypothetical protein
VVKSSVGSVISIRDGLSSTMDRTYAVVAALLVGLFPLASMADTPTPAPSGIEGVISVSPSRPGPIRKDSPSVAPVPNIEFVVKKGGARVASFTTNAEGRFQISLPPGHYIVMREDAGARVGHWRFEVDVLAGEVAKVNWTGDSGIH